MRFLKYIFCALLFVTASVADTININWINDGATYAQTTCEIGGDVILPTTPTKRGYTFKGWVAGYTRLEYIESTGTQYIDTSVEYSTNAVLDIQATATTSDVVTFFLSPIDSNTFTQGFGQYKSAVAGQNELNISVRTMYNVDYTNEVLTVNDVINPGYKLPNNSRLSLFGSIYKNRRAVGLKMYSARIYTETSLVFNGIPAKRNSDNKIGMYDTVSNTFLTNAGTGEFIAGPVAENQNFYE